MICTSCQKEIDSSSHCSNIPSSMLPGGLVDFDTTDRALVLNAGTLAYCVRNTISLFPAEEGRSAPMYKRNLCHAAAQCAISADMDEEDAETLANNLTKMIFDRV